MWSDVGKLRHGVTLVAVLRITFTKYMEYCPVSSCNSGKSSSCQCPNSQGFPPTSTSTQFKVFWVLDTLISGKNLSSRGSAGIFQVSSSGC